MAEEKLVNNYEFARLLDQFTKTEIEVLAKKVEEAHIIVSNENYKWENAKQKESALVRYEAMKTRLETLKYFQEKAKDLIKQHEGLTDVVAKWYVLWYENVSNNGKQETEMMEMQASFLQQIFEHMHQVIEPLKLNLKQPIK